MPLTSTQHSALSIQQAGFITHAFGHKYRYKSGQSGGVGGGREPRCAALLALLSASLLALLSGVTVAVNTWRPVTGAERVDPSPTAAPARPSPPERSRPPAPTSCFCGPPRVPCGSSDVHPVLTQVHSTYPRDCTAPQTSSLSSAGYHKSSDVLLVLTQVHSTSKSLSPPSALTGNFYQTSLLLSVPSPASIAQFAGPPGPVCTVSKHTTPLSVWSSSATVTCTPSQPVSSLRGTPSPTSTSSRERSTGGRAVHATRRSLSAQAAQGYQPLRPLGCG